MSWVILVAFLLLILLAVIQRLGLLGREEESLPYTKNLSLFTPAEISFLNVLEQAIGDGYRILGKVRVADVISVKATADRSAWRTAFNRISAKHFDFVICQAIDLAIVAVVELED